MPSVAGEAQEGPGQTGYLYTFGSSRRQKKLIFRVSSSISVISQSARPLFHLFSPTSRFRPSLSCLKFLPLHLQDLNRRWPLFFPLPPLLTPSGRKPHSPGPLARLVVPSSLGPSSHPLSLSEGPPHGRSPAPFPLIPTLSTLPQSLTLTAVLSRSFGRVDRVSKRPKGHSGTLQPL